MPEKEVVDGEPDQGQREGRDDDAHPEGIQPADHLEPDVGADHVEGAPCEVEDPHDTESQGEARSQQERMNAYDSPFSPVTSTVFIRPPSLL